MGEGNVNGRDQDSVFSSEMGSMEAGAVPLMGYEKEGFLEKDTTSGWAAVEREREEMREMKLRLKQRNSPKSKTAIKDHRMQGTPRKKRPLEQLAAVPGSESGETDDATEKLENKHDVVENASRCVESVSTKQRDVRRSERKIVKMLAPSELKKKEENMYSRNKGLTDDEKGSTEKNGNEEGSENIETCDVVTNMKKKCIMEEHGNAESTLCRSKGRRNVSKQGRNIAKRLSLSELKWKDETQYSQKENTALREGPPRVEKISVMTWIHMLSYTCCSLPPYPLLSLSLSLSPFVCL